MSTTYKNHFDAWRGCQRCPLWRTRNKVVVARGKVPAPILFVGEAPGTSEDVLGMPFVGPAGKLLDQIIQRAWGGRWDYAMTNLVGCIPKPVPPTVVNVKYAECDVEIGRPSEWGNPYLIGRDGTREKVIAKYAEHLRDRPGLIEKLAKLAGKRLGCFCKPLPCHGDVIVEAFKRIVGTDKTGEPSEESIAACAPRLDEFARICRPSLVVCVGKLAEKYVLLSTYIRMSNIPRVAIIHPAAILRADVSQQGLAVQRTMIALEDAVENL